jgi:hypothetical protein
LRAAFRSVPTDLRLYGAFMRLVGTALLLAVTASPAFAQREPVIVIPGKAGVPVIINGIDASWGIVDGEFGLDRPGLMAPTVVYRPLLITYPTAPPRPFFPQEGKRPGYGRLEIIPPPNRPLPPPAPTYYRSWSSSSGNTEPVTIMPPNYPMPNIDVYTGFGGGGRRHRGHGPKPPGPKGP